MRKFAASKLKEILDEIVTKCARKVWVSTAEQLNKYLDWEFDNNVVV